MRHRIALCDSDRDYAGRIAAFVRNSDFRKEVELTVFGSPDAFAEWAKRESFDVLVASVEFAPQLRGTGEERCLWISEGGEAGPGGETTLPKYDAAPRLLRAWMRHSRNPANAAERKEAPIAAVWSVGGGVGKTKLVSEIARVWAGNGLSPFVVGTDPGIYDGAETMPATFHDLGDWLYAIKCGKSPKPDERQTGAASRLHYFLPESPYREFAELSREEARELLRVTAAAAACDVVLIELESPWSAFAAETFQRADALLLVSAADDRCMRKTEKWLEENANRWETPGMEHKTIYALNKALPDRESADSIWAAKAYRLPYVPEWKQDGKRRDAIFDRTAMQVAEVLWARCVNG